MEILVIFTGLIFLASVAAFIKGCGHVLLNCKLAYMNKSKFSVVIKKNKMSLCSGFLKAVL